MADGQTKQAVGGGTTDVSIVVPVYNEDQMDEGVKSSWRDFIKQLRYILVFRFGRLHEARGS